jgi:hypothetical protein
MFRLAQREGLDLPRIEPRVTFQYDCDAKIHATLRFPTPVDRVTRTEQLILRHVIATRGQETSPVVSAGMIEGQNGRN